jgi:formylglycine-generating enzyme
MNQELIKPKVTCMKSFFHRTFSVTLLAAGLFASGPALSAFELRVAPTGAQQIRLSWAEVAGASSYKIFQANTLAAVSAAEWDEIADVEDLYYDMAAGGLLGFYCVAAITVSPGTLVFVQGGTFNNDTNAITLSSFWIDQYEVTQGSYKAVMGYALGTNYGGGDNFPAYYVSWFRAVEYCNRRSIQEGLAPCYTYSTNGTNPDDWPSGWQDVSWNHENISCNWSAVGYRLPTEMEWMYAAWGGIYIHYYTYSGGNTIGTVAWYSGNSDYLTRAVGTKAPNELGLYDMTGNVNEWVWDRYAAYPAGPQTNPTGSTNASFRVFRGGSYRNNSAYCHLEYRQSAAPTAAYNNAGFRVARISN